MNWEYEVIEVQVAKEGFVVKPELQTEAFKQQLNELGGEGWELVSIFDVNMLQGGSKQVVAAFKRPVAVEEAPAEVAPVPPPLPQD